VKVEKETHPYIVANLIQKHNVKLFAEIGVKDCIMFEFVMRQIGPEIREYWAIDRWEAPAHKDRNQYRWEKRHEVACQLMTYYPTLRVLRAHAIQAARLVRDGYFDAIFLDTSHEYNRTKNEILAWIPKVKKGGIFAGHDFDTHTGMYHGGVKKAVREVWGEDFDLVPDGAFGTFVKYL